LDEEDSSSDIKKTSQITVQGWPWTAGGCVYLVVQCGGRVFLLSWDFSRSLGNKNTASFTAVEM
jgi:hypothetical protein